MLKCSLRNEQFLLHHFTHCKEVTVFARLQPNNEDVVKRVLGGEKPGAKASSSGDKERKSRDSSADKRKRRDKEVGERSRLGCV